jgi:hypothetical protein
MLCAWQQSVHGGQWNQQNCFCIIDVERITPMTVQYIKKQASKLNANSRAKLARYLLSTLDNLSESENETLWAEEALKRHDDLIKGKAKSRSAELVFKQARARMQ